MMKSKELTKMLADSYSILDGIKLSLSDTEIHFRNFQKSIALKKAGNYVDYQSAIDIVSQANISLNTKNVLLLNAGVGAVAHALLSKHDVNLVCVEPDLDSCRIGERLVQSATWLNGDPLDFEFVQALGFFDLVLAWHPMSEKKIIKRRSPESLLRLRCIASSVAGYALFFSSQREGGELVLL